MRYDEKLLHITNKLCENDGMYSLILLEARSLSLTLSGYRCFLDGKYILCLNMEDNLSIHTGRYTAVNLSFQPYFYNVNLNHDIIGMEFYDEMREKYGYPDFRLFRVRNHDYFGIIPISDEEFDAANLYISRAKFAIASCELDVMWSCRARSEIISVLHIAESAYLGKESGLVNEIVRYINDHVDREITLNDLCLRFRTNRTTVSDIIKEKTGMPPMKYVLAVRLNKSKPDLLFTKLPIHEIAEKYGFSDPNYYIRAFKKQMGVSPLRFRKEGWETRIRDESIYRSRAEEEKKDMTVKEFCDYYEKGLGRAIIRLKQQKDKEPYQKAFADLCINKKGHRVLDLYEKEILDVFDDAAFTKEFAEQLLAKMKEKSAYTAATPLLILLGYRETVTELLEKNYQESYSQLLTYTKKPWDGEKYPPFANIYATVSGAMARFLKVGDERVKKILFDMADLYDYCQYPVIPTYQNPLFQIWDGVGREYFFPILDEVISEHPNGSKLDIRKQFIATSEDKREIPDVTVSELLSHKELNRDNWHLFEGFYHNGSEELKKAVAKAAIEEKDIEKQIFLLNFFTIGPYGPENSPVEFPLDVAPLIEMAEKEGFALPDEPPYGLTEPVLQILANTKCRAAHDLAMRFYYDNSIPQKLRDHIVAIRFGKNYLPETDKSDFVALMLSENPSERNWAIDLFAEDIRNDVEGLPLDMIPYVFVHIQQPYWRRKELCEVLLEKDLMPENLKEESLYDANKLTRELFLKTKKPKKPPYHVFLSAPDMP